MLVTQIYALGVAILVAAMIFNFVAMKVHIMTWYGFVKKPSTASWLDYLWLFAFYPGLLGVVAYATTVLLNI